MAGFAVETSDILTGDEEIDLVTLVDKQDALAAEARAALPYTFDECTYARGPLRQSVFSCLDCGAKGVCYGCSISCHAEHRLVELWTKRGFTCDCPTEAMATCSADASSSSAAPRKCALNPPEEQPYPPNEGNRYTHNFTGEFCRCGREYDPVTEPEAMVHCIGCEDWFHESCLNLQPRRTEFASDEEDEEAECLVPSDTYDGLVCAACVEKHPLLVEKRGTTGWMVLEPRGEGWVVVGKEEVAEEKKVEEGSGLTKAEDGESAEHPAATEPAPSPASAPVDSTKRPLDAEPDTGSKRARVEDEADEPEAEPVTKVEPATPAKAAGDVFLSHGLRETLAATLSPDTAAALPFPLVDEEIYEPAEDTEAETLEQVTERVVGALPRVQAIEALYGYQAMRDKLKVMLAARAQAGTAVSREDIEDFFDTLRNGPSQGWQPPA